MCQAVQRAQFEIRHGDIWIIARRREHRESLNVNVGYGFASGEGMPANSMSERMNDEIRTFRCVLGLAHDIHADLDCVTHELPNHFEGVESGIVELTAQILRLSCQGNERNLVLLHEGFEAGGRSQFHGMPVRHQADRQRQERLDIAARTVGEDCDVHQVDVWVVPLSPQEGNDRHPAYYNLKSP